MLVERDDLLAGLLGLAAEGFGGRGRMVFLAGEAGVGKSALCRELVRAVEDRCAVRVGGVDNLTTADALAAFEDAVPELEIGPSVARHRLFRSLRDILRTEPTLVVLEDLHWADEATLDALRFLGRRMADTPVLIVVTYRHDEVSARHPLRLVLGDLATHPDVHRVTVPPLTPAGVAVMVEASGTDLDARALHARTGGNAFFVTEVLAAHGDEVPATVRDAVLARVSRLSEAAASVAAGAAILGTPSGIDLLTRVSDQPVAAVDECLDAGVLIVGSDGVGFRHELARQAVESTLPVEQRSALHRKALEELTAIDPSDHRTLAHHAQAAGEGELAVRHACAAAQRAAELGAHREAVAQYQLALNAGSAVGMETAQRAAIFDDLSYECYLTDRVPEAITARQRALELHGLLGAHTRIGDDQRWLSRLSWFLGRNDDAERYAARALRTLEPLGESAELAMALSNLAQLRMLAGDNDEAVTWGERAIAVARRLADREVEVHALNNVGSALGRAGHVADGEALLRRSLDLALTLGQDGHEHAARAFTNLGSTAAESRRFPDAVRFLAAGIAYCEERDLDSWSRYMGAWQVVCLTETGAWDEAHDAATTLLAHPDLSPISAIPAAAALARIEARRGEDASTHLSLATSLAEPTNEVQRIAPAACAAAEAAWLRGSAVEVLEITQRAVSLARAHSDPWALGELLWWRSIAGGPAPDSDLHAVNPFALMLCERWDAAAEAWQALGCPYWTALSLGFAEEVDAAQQAVGTLRGLGATAVIEALLRTRRERGLALPRRPRAAARYRAGGLTDRELDVLRLLSEGLSTADIAERLVLSPRTVEHHVSAVLGKLDEPSRARAVATARRLHLLDESVGS